MRLGKMVVATVSLAAFAAPAQASSLRILYHETGASVTYTAEQFETNHLRMSWDPATRVLSVRDDGITIRPIDEAASCTGTADRLECVLTSNPKFVSAELMDGDDEARVRIEPEAPATALVTVYAGDGNDTVHAAAFETSTQAGAGDDSLFGDWGDDGFRPGLGRDEMHGGAGFDTVSYEDGIQDTQTSAFKVVSVIPGVRVSFDDVANDGYPSEGDNAHSDIEDAIGSPYADVLEGTEGPNLLDGLDGNDQLDGRGGDDILFGGWGDDLLVGGPGSDWMTDRISGNDTLIADDGEPDLLNCGAGSDTAFVDAFDTFELRQNCDSITVR